MTDKTYQNWKLNKDSDNLLWLTFDRQGMSVNTLNGDVLVELEQVIEEIAKDSSIKGVIIKSGKAKGFIAGADIDQFGKFKDEGDAFDLVRKAQIIYDNLEALKPPTVAMIDGFCLGGGLELALACRYRVADESESTRLGLPEVKLGIHPGWGGSVRLPRYIGPLKAFDLILTGRTVSGRAAAKLGFVDVAVPKRHLERAARMIALHPPAPVKATLLGALLNTKLMRPLVGRLFYKNLKAKVRRDHYPAPYAVVNNWVKYGVYGDAPMIYEARSIAKFFLSDTSRNLVRVFRLQERLKGLARGDKFKPQHVHVIGAGTMGGDIAAWCAFSGMHVTLQDRAPEYIAPAIKRAAKLFEKKLKLPRLVQGAMDRLIPDPAGLGVKTADIIIEAIFENLQVKQDLFKDLEAKAKPDCILATNTSSIPLDEINVVMKDPSRLVGIHFFNPVALMQLVEIVKGDKTSDVVVAKAMSFVGAINRLPIPVKSSPGFLVNRILMPYLMECVTLLDEGVAPEAIDKAALDFGMPMGPVELADTVGLDVCLDVAQNLSQHLGGTVPDNLKAKTAQKHLGRKTGEGFYKYDKNGKRIKNKSKSNVTVPVDVADRLIMRMLNESVTCLREHVTADADLLDAGMIFGTGFAPFRGGPMHYVKERGAKSVYDTLQSLEQKYGDRFKPDAGWQNYLD